MAGANYLMNCKFFYKSTNAFVLALAGMNGEVVRPIAYCVSIFTASVISRQCAISPASHF